MEFRRDQATGRPVAIVTSERPSCTGWAILSGTEVGPPIPEFLLLRVDLVHHHFQVLDLVLGMNQSTAKCVPFLARLQRCSVCSVSSAESKAWIFDFVDGEHQGVLRRG